MQITTTARHCELDEGIRAHAHQRLEKLSKFARDIVEVHLVVTAEKFRHLAEITLRVDGRELISREQADLPLVAIDLASDRLEEQMRRLKERRVAERKGNRTRTADGLAAATPAEDDGGDPTLQD